ncbi:MAG: hypothetical protein K2X04_01920 [Burkholderiales bacterium]|nr:hypothetical protein [Burkholderiales bacterium]
MKSLDIIIITLIGIGALLWIGRLLLRIKRKTEASICNGCSIDTPKVKHFTAQDKGS